MIKKLFFLIILLLSASFVSAGQNCFFDSQNGSCETVKSSFITFNLNFTNNVSLDYFEAEIYDKNNPSNKVQVQTDILNKKVTNLNPFTNSGVFVLKINAFNNGGILKTSFFEFIVDKTQPLPPIIPLKIISDKIIGFTQFPNQLVFAKKSDGTIISNVSNNNSEFSLNLSLAIGINKIDFYTQNSFRQNSQIIERVAFDSKIVENKTLIISTINLADLNQVNGNTINLITSKRNFYVQGSITNPTGTNLKGGVLYINGIKTLTDVNGNFGNFILLNEGLNTINIENFDGSLKKDINVTFINSKFAFLNVESNKVISNLTNPKNIFFLKGKVNYKLPFNVYLNGNLTKTISMFDINSNFNENISGLIPGKNYLYLEGLDGESFSKIIYYDTKSPIITPINFENAGRITNFYFKIEDDISVDINSIVLNFNKPNSNTIYFSGEQIVKTGDFYKVDIKNLADGNYSYSIIAKDLVKNSNYITGNLNLSLNNTVIEEAYIPNGYIIGNQIFLDSNNLNINFFPSKFIAFKQILLDGKSVNNYEILRNSQINLKLTTTKKNGTLKLDFINNKHENFSQTFYYFTDLEKPQLNLDYISNPSGNQENIVKVTGEILDSHFNWESLRFNSQANFLKYGNNFEAFVNLNVGQENLEIVGNDFALNQMNNSFFGGILALDNTSLILQKSNSLNSQSFQGSFTNGINNKVFQYLTSYDGFKFTKAYIVSNNFQLPIHQREGIRSLNLKGLKGSSNIFLDKSSFTIDATKPKIYLVNKSGNYELIIDGTLSQIDRSNLAVYINNSPNAILNSYCNDKLSVFSECIALNNNFNSIKVFANDMAGNLFNQTILKSSASNFTKLTNYPNLPIKIYFSGNNLNTIFSESFVQGQIKSSSPISSVKANGRSCEFDDFNFYCNVSTTNLINVFNIKVRNINGRIGNNNWTITRFVNNLSVNLNNISGISVYKANSNYFIIHPNFNVGGNLSENSILKLLVNGNPYLLGNSAIGNFSVLVNISENINEKETENLNLTLIANGKNDLISSSNSVTVIYNRIVKTLVNIFLN